jgi:hypothetical protein
VVNTGSCCRQQHRAPACLSIGQHEGKPQAVEPPNGDACAQRVAARKGSSAGAPQEAAAANHAAPVQAVTCGPRQSTWRSVVTGGGGVDAATCAAVSCNSTGC